MGHLITLAAQLFFLACTAWVISVSIFALCHFNRPWQFGLRQSMVFVAVTALTMAMAVALVNGPG